MNAWDDKINWKVSENLFISVKKNTDKVIAFEKGDVLFVFNFHPTQVSKIYYI